MTPFIGQIMPVGFNFAPAGWALCDGQILAISQNTALFSLLGTTFGGNGTSSFGLPDLRGRAIKHVGNGPGLEPVIWGEVGGSEYTTITVPHMPAHNHTAILFAETAPASLNNPQNNMLASHQGYAPANPNTNKPMNAESITVGTSGGSIPIDTRDPYLGIYVCIAMEGIYPSRS